MARQAPARSLRFTCVWTIRNEPSVGTSAMLSQPARTCPEDINVAPDESFIEAHLRGHGFCHDGKDPVTADAVTAAAGLTGEILDFAGTRAEYQEPNR
ncbi:hypothetical protein [Amycolatopsis sp. NBC_01480]|uniref:hypothetical protein n=1 Tax=Amycolatopsis sp. NBC_01480 TaxID=2903562 RepID=UPI002E292054|nr:hypothetical protein [Amycolatopsis sp. NBC_01480]